MQARADVNELTERGWTVADSAVAPELVQRLVVDLERATVQCRRLQAERGLADVTAGTSHHLVAFGGSFLDFLDELPLAREIGSFFGGPFILNSFGGVIATRENVSYVGNIHRDQRSFSGDFPVQLNMLVMLDDLTEDNGATYVMPGSHRLPERPSEERFYASAERLLGSSGSVVLFNSNLWHAAGRNHADSPRRILTPTFSRPFVKQQCDYPRLVGYEHAESLSEDLRQLLGYNARVPASLDEWYQPPERRMYRPGQG